MRISRALAALILLFCSLGLSLRLKSRRFNWKSKLHAGKDSVLGETPNDDSSTASDLYIDLSVLNSHVTDRVHIAAHRTLHELLSKESNMQMSLLISFHENYDFTNGGCEEYLREFNLYATQNQDEGLVTLVLMMWSAIIKELQNDLELIKIENSESMRISVISIQEGKEIAKKSRRPLSDLLTGSDSRDEQPTNKRGSTTNRPINWQEVNQFLTEITVESMRKKMILKNELKSLTFFDELLEESEQPVNDDEDDMLSFYGSNPIIGGDSKHSASQLEPKKGEPGFLLESLYLLGFKEQETQINPSKRDTDINILNIAQQLSTGRVSVSLSIDTILSQINNEVKEFALKHYPHLDMTKYPDNFFEDSFRSVGSDMKIAVEEAPSSPNKGDSARERSSSSSRKYSPFNSWKENIDVPINNPSPQDLSLQSVMRDILLSSNNTKDGNHSFPFKLDGEKDPSSSASSMRKPVVYDDTARDSDSAEVEGAVGWEVAPPGTSKSATDAKRISTMLIDPPSEPPFRNDRGDHDNNGPEENENRRPVDYHDLLIGDISDFEGIGNTRVMFTTTILLFHSNSSRLSCHSENKINR